MKESEAEQSWCPMGRISIQKGTSQARIEAVQTGAFNRAVVYAPGSYAQGEWAYPSRCLGEGCAWWRWGTFSGMGLIPAKHRCGCCGLLSPRRPFFLNLVVGAAVLFLVLYNIFRFNL